MCTIVQTFKVIETKKQKKELLFSKDALNWCNIDKMNAMLIIIKKNSWANQHIRMISEGSCDTEDWSNDAENSALITGINYILKYFKLQ